MQQKTDRERSIKYDWELFYITIKYKKRETTISTQIVLMALWWEVGKWATPMVSWMMGSSETLSGTHPIGSSFMPPTSPH